MPKTLSHPTRTTLTYQYLLHHREELDDAGLKKTSILPVLNYAQALETAIQEDDLVTMRRHERAERYLDPSAPAL